MLFYFEEEGITARLTAANEAEDIFNIELGSISMVFKKKFKKIVNFKHVGLLFIKLRVV